MAMVIPPQVNRNAVGWLSIPWVRFMPKIPASRKNKNILVPQGAGLEPWNQGFGAVLFWGGSGSRGQFFLIFLELVSTSTFDLSPIQEQLLIINY